MSLRPLLIATIVAGIAAIATSQFVVRPHIRALGESRNRALLDLKQEKIVHEKTTTVLKETQATLASVEKAFGQTKSELAAANNKAAEQQRRANGLGQDLAQTKQTLAGVKADLAAWNGPGISVDQIRGLVAEVKKLRSANEALNEELRMLTIILAKTRPVDPEAEPSLPSNLTGRIVAVDPKYDFVVLDIGAAKGVLPKGNLLVSRNSKLIAKLKVDGVQEERSIANIVAGWKLGQVMEGDQVIVR